MKYLRYFLYGLIMILGFALMHIWQAEHPVKAQTPALTRATTSAPMTAFDVRQKQLTNIPDSRLVHVKTDVLNVDIDTLGGTIVHVALAKYPKDNHGANIPFTLLNNEPGTFYVAQSGFSKARKPSQLVQYKVAQRQFTLGADQKSLSVRLEGQTPGGLQIVKTFVFQPDRYLVEVHDHVVNTASQDWTGYQYMKLSREYHPIKRRSLFSLPTFSGIAFSKPDAPFNKIAFKKLQKKPLNENIEDGWITMIQQYFLSVWVPPSKQTYHYYSEVEQGLYTIGMHSPALVVPAKQTIDLQTKFYAGPKIADRLSQVAPKLPLTVDYSSFTILSFLAIGIFWLLKHIYNIIGNWGWSIIFVTIIIKMLFYHLSAASYKSMAKMRKLQPKMAMLKERFGDDKQAFSREVMQLYKREKVNPLGGCLPVVIQIPVFLALYWVLLGSVELRQAPFMFWIKDLSVHDPYYVLPILMGITMFIQQKLSPAPADATQAKMMMFLPVIMTVFFLGFPAGLVLYWLLNNVLSVLQQWYITRQVEAGAYVTKSKSRSKRKSRR